MRVRARLSAVLVAPACALALAACGGGSDGEQPLADTAPSPTAPTASAPTLSPSPVPSPSAPAAGTSAPAATSGSTTPRSTPTYATPSAPVTVSPTPSGDAAAADDLVREVKVTVAGGKVTPPPSHVDVTKGTVVRIIVTSDVADEMHVHGYDLEGELPAGQPGSVEFTANRTGSFEVETHESGLLLFQLLVK
ncbi:cupredoxin domain-containing protein [Motilibacter deserti]|uniref:EfeO-type cupredoxin-like domain-containing protein n=1 Tax=Motilibacter deserti TaxID=2714956 RepID=A0ABX0GTN9_9ACTN|nr:hypothetical protein [Motilibacter deserti]NHC13019.1 hypothetical protein [Motilibacter deserti]